MATFAVTAFFCFFLPTTVQCKENAAHIYSKSESGSSWNGNELPDYALVYWQPMSFLQTVLLFFKSNANSSCQCLLKPIMMLIQQ